MPPPELRELDLEDVRRDAAAVARGRGRTAGARPPRLAGEGLHRHPVSMNILLGMVRTRFWLQWEDDWSLPQDTNILMRARQVRFDSGSSHAPWRAGGCTPRAVLDLT